MLKLCRDYRVEWEKVRKEKLQMEISQLNSKLNSLAVSSGEGDEALITSLSAGREISDIYLAPTADEMSGDSEGEEVSGFNVNGTLFLFKFNKFAYYTFFLHKMLILKNKLL